MKPTPEELTRCLVVGLELEPRVINLAAGLRHDNEEDSLRVLSTARMLHKDHLPARAGETAGYQYYFGQLYPDLGALEAAGIECRDPMEAVLNAFILIQLLGRAAKACELRLALRSNYHAVPSSMHVNVSFGTHLAADSTERALAQSALALLYGNLALSPGPMRSQRAMHIRETLTSDWRKRPLLHVGGKEPLDLPPPWVVDMLRTTDAGKAFLLRAGLRRSTRHHDGCYDLTPSPTTVLKVCESHVMILMMTLLGEMPRLEDEGLEPLAFLRRYNRLTVDAAGELVLPEPVRAINRALAEQAQKMVARHPDAFPPFFARRAEAWLAESSMSTRELAARCRIHGYVKWYAGLLPFLLERNVSVGAYLHAATEQALMPTDTAALGPELVHLATLCPEFVEAYLKDARVPDTRETKLLSELAALDLLLDIWDERASRTSWPEAPSLQDALRAGPRKVLTRADARSELLGQLLKEKPRSVMFYWTGALVAELNGETCWVPFTDVLEPTLTQQRVPVSGRWPQV